MAISSGFSSLPISTGVILFIRVSPSVCRQLPPALGPNLCIQICSDDSSSEDYPRSPKPSSSSLQPEPEATAPSPVPALIASLRLLQTQLVWRIQLIHSLLQCPGEASQRGTAFCCATRCDKDSSATPRGDSLRREPARELPARSRRGPGLSAATAFAPRALFSAGACTGVS